MLMPRKVKHRKWHRLRPSGTATRRTDVSFGIYGLKAVTSSWITARQIEAARRAMTRFIKRGGKVWVRIFPHQSVTIKGGESRGGGGKGAVDHYVEKIQKGTVLFEMDGVDETTAREALRLASHKLPIQTRFIVKE